MFNDVEDEWWNGCWPHGTKHRLAETFWNPVGGTAFDGKDQFCTNCDSLELISITFHMEGLASIIEFCHGSYSFAF
jgi:hypothetical protein